MLVAYGAGASFTGWALLPHAVLHTLRDGVQSEPCTTQKDAKEAACQLLLACVIPGWQVP